MDLLPLLLTSPWIYPVTAAMTTVDVLIPAVPSEATVIGAGVFATTTGITRLLLVAAAAAIGVIAGDHLSYAVGRSVLGPRLLGRSRRLRTAVAAISRQLERRGGTLIVTSRFLPGGRTTVTLACGIAGYPRRRFAWAVVVGAVLWAAWTAALGFAGGAVFASHPVAGFVAGVSLSLLITGVVELIRRRLERIRNKPSVVAEGVPNSAAYHRVEGDQPWQPCSSPTMTPTTVS